MLGQGGLGELYLATDNSSGQALAVRVLAQDLLRSEATVEKLRAKVKAASSLSHKNIARSFGMGRERTHRFIAAEFIDGRSLRSVIARKKKANKTVGIETAYNIISHLCNALTYAGDTMPHGLPAPGSVLINKAGRVKLADFGLASTLAPAVRSTSRLADLRYLAPELSERPDQPSCTSDVYTLGLVLHELVSGRLPSDPTSIDMSLPDALRSLLQRCLAPVGSRIHNAEGLKLALHQALHTSHLAKVEASVKQSLTETVGNPMARQVSIEELLAAADTDSDERWLVQKDRLDFGPFSLGSLKRALFRGEFSGDEFLLDQETGQRVSMRHAPGMAEFIRQLEHHQSAQRAHEVEKQRRQGSRRRRNTMVILLLAGVLLLGGGAVLVAYRMQQQPQVRERIVYRERNNGPPLKGLHIQWKAEPKEQARRRRAMSRRRRRGRRKASKAGQEVTYLGDASKSGGDELLSQKVVQQVMRKNFRRLTGCVRQAWRRDPKLSKVSIDFGVQGTGQVRSVRVNGLDGGPFHDCIAAKMAQIRFPKFDGPLTRASFSMSLQK